MDDLADSGIETVEPAVAYSSEHRSAGTSSSLPSDSGGAAGARAATLVYRGAMGHVLVTWRSPRTWLSGEVFSVIRNGDQELSIALDVLRVGDLPDPALGPTDVPIGVNSVALDRVNLYWRDVQRVALPHIGGPISLQSLHSRARIIMGCQCSAALPRSADGDQAVGSSL
ncbi:hypothetical protein [Prescottella agglutinans]|uniref:hypothetical protein n=1 Tax=Prescottella agglutinans TaxID=1644129 RepID=UPI003D99CD32